ncbi:MAG: hypothetical protein GC178_06015 [Flavobacteriales bacterium]|nr:hypothetical protein [Flavobacteriales bacterium]
MKQITLVLALAMAVFASTEAVGQNKAASQTKVESTRTPENVKKEADALKARIDQYVEKIEANKNNPKVDYSAEQERIKEMKAHYEAVKSEWEKLTGQKWKEEKE